MKSCEFFSTKMKIMVSSSIGRKPILCKVLYLCYGIIPNLNYNNIIINIIGGNFRHTTLNDSVRQDIIDSSFPSYTM